MPLYISETCPTVVYFSERHALYLLHFRRQCVLASHFLLPRKKCLSPPPLAPLLRMPWHPGVGHGVRDAPASGEARHAPDGGAG